MFATRLSVQPATMISGSLLDVLVNAARRQTRMQTMASLCLCHCEAWELINDDTETTIGRGIDDESVADIGAGGVFTVTHVWTNVCGNLALHWTYMGKKLMKKGCTFDLKIAGKLGR